MNIIKKIFPFFQNRRDILERCKARRAEMYRHVHFSTRINDDYTTDTFICIDEVRVAKVCNSGENPTKSEGEFLIYQGDVEKKMKYLRGKYYQNHKKEYIV